MNLWYVYAYVRNADHASRSRVCSVPAVLGSVTAYPPGTGSPSCQTRSAFCLRQGNGLRILVLDDVPATIYYDCVFWGMDQRCRLLNCSPISHAVPRGSPRQPSSRFFGSSSRNVQATQQHRSLQY
ncbi:unnamed protein product [Pleuronectes platessa]|uniref:Uncharacterized protein n=1 Tax=Pleuronectes platessa TaxID=8262 RepID=A0A9N7U5Z3_PLEPL|nr:unnamed protein product [Pleuronectes platessa]